MKLIILEGIATSGKTTVKNKVMTLLAEKGLTFSVVEEDETLMPILNNTDKQVSLDLLKKTIKKALREEKDYIIFDRLFFTHIIRTKSSLKDFREIESMIEKQALLVFLKIDEIKIPERIAYAKKHRGKQWNEYVDKKGDIVKITQYYAEQQKLLKNLLNKTSLQYKIYNTTNLDFENISEDILSTLLPTAVRTSSSRGSKGRQKTLFKDL